MARGKKTGDTPDSPASPIAAEAKSKRGRSAAGATVPKKTVQSVVPAAGPSPAQAETALAANDHFAGSATDTNVAAQAHGHSSNGHQINEEDIRRRAYEYYEQRGRQGGAEWDDWLRAEQELRSKR